MKVLNGKYYGLYKLICDEDVLFGAYHSMISNPGNMPPGVYDQTLDGLSNSKIAGLASDLIKESFQFKPSKRIWIQKANGKMRSLGIPSPIDTIVHKAMAIILQQIFEPEFSKFSHGFIPKRGCHTALRQLSQWSGNQWAIEVDIKGFFDNVDHHVLADLLQKKIGDQQFIDLFWKLVKAGYVEEGVNRDSMLGVPQGGIVSAILSNIYLHEFDQYVEMLINQFSSTAKDITKINPVYDKFTRRIQYLRDKYPIPQQISLEEVSEIVTLKETRRKVTSRLSNVTRVRYVRYADDWVVGIYGPENFANEIKNLLATFLTQELKLELSNEKTKITNLLNNKAIFLGFYFMVYKPQESKFTVYHKDGHIRRAKIVPNRIRLLAPVDKILSKLSINGFLKNYQPKSKIIPNAKTNWIFLDHQSILSRYNLLIRGLLNYYSVANNRYIFHLIVNFILRHSCAKTLARKFNLRSRAKVFAKFGKNLTTNNPKMSFLNEPHYRRLSPAHTSLSNPFDLLNWQLITQNNFWKPCLICGSTLDIEMHHVKHIRKANQEVKGFTKIMSSLNRKQIPVCQLCHDKIHKEIIRIQS
jgi:group II intron reverse transcriptase/maturase